MPGLAALSGGAENLCAGGVPGLGPPGGARLVPLHPTLLPRALAVAQAQFLSRYRKQGLLSKGKVSTG